MLIARFAISTCIARYGRYILVRQVAGTRTVRYRAVPLKIDRRRSISAVGGQLREKSTADGRLREKLTVGGRLSEKKGRRRRRGKEEKKKRGEEPRSRVAACGSPAPVHRHCLQVVGAFSPTQGERSRQSRLGDKKQEKEGEEEEEPRTLLPSNGEMMARLLETSIKPRRLLILQTHSQAVGAAHEEHDSEQYEREVGYSPRAEEAQSREPTWKRSHKERIIMAETRLDVLEASLE
ncbi:hypothetical protein GW17_00030519 [Ensete ventricosum]|nr:hypothetical protein GW17_00030519 [Ensete ventricosum]